MQGHIYVSFVLQPEFTCVMIDDYMLRALEQVRGALDLQNEICT
jgi:hypothetical protein